MKDQQIQLGDRVKDVVSTFTGICVCISTWLNGCVRIAIQAEKLGKDGEPTDARNFDRETVKVVKAGVHKPMILVQIPLPPTPVAATTGGPAREGRDFAKRL